MLIRQRRTMIDPILLDVVCPFLRARGLDRMIPVGRLWNHSLRTRRAAVATARTESATAWPEAMAARLHLVRQATQNIAHQKP